MPLIKLYEANEEMILVEYTYRAVSFSWGGGATVNIPFTEFSHNNNVNKSLRELS